MSKVTLESIAAEFRSGNSIPVERATFTRERMQEVLEAYADARVREAQQWISVEDRMPPEDDTLVLALHGGNEPEVVFGFLLHETLDAWAYTHWMPLPAPPTDSRPGQP